MTLEEDLDAAKDHIAEQELIIDTLKGRIIRQEQIIQLQFKTLEILHKKSGL